MVRELKRRLTVDDADIIELGTAGIGILDYARGYNRLILVDAIVSGAEPGTVHELRGADVSRTSHLGPGHDADLPTVLALGEKLVGDAMPREVIVVAVEVADIVSVSADLTPQVEAAVSKASSRIEALCRAGRANAV